MSTTAIKNLPLNVVLQQAVAHHQAGQLKEAEQLYRAILDVQPNHLAAKHNLHLLSGSDGQIMTGLPSVRTVLTVTPTQSRYSQSNVGATGYRSSQGSAEKRHEGGSDDARRINQLVALFSGGHYIQLEREARQLIEDNPDFGFAWNALGLSLLMQGKDMEALPVLQKAAKLLPDDADVHSNIGNTLKRLGRLDEAVVSYQRALEIKPDFAVAHCNLGVAMRDLGQPERSVASCRRALEIKSDYAEAHYNLGIALHDLNRVDEAIESYRRALAIRPGYLEAHYNLGCNLQELGRFDEAVTSYRRALEIKPDLVEAYLNLGAALHGLGQFDAAAASYQRALEIRPDLYMAHCNLGTAQRMLGRLDEAVASYRRALDIKPDFVLAHNNLGILFQARGQIAGAIECFNQALVLKPDYGEAHSNLIFTLDLSEADLAVLQKERRRWDQTHASHLIERLAHDNLADPERRLRIGYVSADFKSHSAPIVFRAMLSKFDSARFEVFAYSNLVAEDAVTEQFRHSVDHWRKIAGQTDEAVAKMIRQDGIDILVDLSGHSTGNRLLVFARKPAPIQITAWGYASSTGMQAMDVFFADPILVPAEEKPLYTEEVRYLACAVGACFFDEFPEVNALPALAAKVITFGSFNRLAKISKQAYALWAQVLLAIPNSRLLLKAADFDKPATRHQVAEQFSQLGIAPERIIMLGRTSWRENMETYHRIDIALDPFPHGGGVTTLEALKMGVPVITLRWPTIPGRISASILTALGLTGWIAETPEQYVEIAIQKAQNHAELADTRQMLRPLFDSSIIGNPNAYVSSVEQEYRNLWRRWCSGSRSI